MCPTNIPFTFFIPTFFLVFLSQPFLFLLFPFGISFSRRILSTSWTFGTPIFGIFEELGGVRGQKNIVCFQCKNVFLSASGDFVYFVGISFLFDRPKKKKAFFFLFFFLYITKHFLLDWPFLYQISPIQVSYSRNFVCETDMVFLSNCC